MKKILKFITSIRGLIILTFLLMIISDLIFDMGNITVSNKELNNIIEALLISWICTAFIWGNLFVLLFLTDFLKEVK